MKNSKKLFLIFLSVLIVAFVSCKKDSGGSITTPTPTFKLSSLVGNWKDGNNKFKVSNSGVISDISINNVPATDTIQIANWDTDKDKEVPKHTENIKDQSSGSYKYDFLFTFTSESICEVTLTEQGKAPTTYTLKKETTATAK
ncbi:hypothetical protein [uncultured Brachyspira sp.]|uniref:hypothetical protein n=1 Tax=uncultured Brachyspira sp. TaxID=221953 RepID=UPI00259216CF|nr:hypothetical protein [uncultured Brachyspira sp.]